jgi:TolB-like protein/DNA-binding winged helix-turn-helix (wHTH) protein/cytochrome c-type biogenesis protein CcmH/NrfG
MSPVNGPHPMSTIYRFGEFLLDPWRHTLSRADSPIFLTPKAFDVLVYLVQNPNRLVSKEELLQAVWQDTFVEAGNLTQYISHLRKALGDNAEDARWIVTIARMGYQFAGDVAVSDEAAPARRVAGQVPVSEGLQTYAPPASYVPKIVVAANRPRPWRTRVVVASSIFMLALAAYLSWHHFRSPELSGTQKIRLAVLPFENLTGDPNKEYLADGLTEQMISQLGRLNPQQLKVIARTSVMGYKHSAVRLDQIGRDLSVEYVLENSLRESGDHMRLTAQLVQVKDQTHLWSQDYDYPEKDILNVEDDVAKSVARQIQVRLTSQQQAGFSRSHPVNPEAFDAYLQGYYFFERNTDKDSDMAAKYFQRATELDSSDALAWVWLSRVRNWQANTGAVSAEESRRAAREAVERALELNPNLAEAHIQMGRIKQQIDLDWVGADASFQRAVELEPGNPEAVRTAAFSAEMLGRFDEALQLDRRAVELDPLNAESWEFRGETEFSMGRLDEATADSKKALELNPDVWPGPILLSQIYVVQGHPQNALAEIELVRYDPARVFLYAVAYYALGRQKEADAALSELIAKYHSRYAYQIAQVYAFRKQSSETFKWLDQAYAQHDSGLIGTNVDPLLKNLHNDPRFAAFLKQIHLPN